MAPKCNAHLCYMYKKIKGEEKNKQTTFELGRETKRRRTKMED